MPGFLAGWFFARIFDGKCVLRPERLWRYLIGISKKKRFCVTYGIVGTDSGENDDFVDSCMFFQPDGG